jgi:hypothetical protein
MPAGSGGGGGGGSSGFAAGTTSDTSVAADTSGVPSVTLTYTPAFALTISRTGQGNGTVTSSDGAISCGSVCSHVYNGGATVTLRAVPAGGSEFAGWSGGGCSGIQACAMTIGSAQTITAVFKQGPPATNLLGSKIGSTKGTATFAFSGTGVTSGFDCTLIRKHGHAHFAACSSPMTYRHLKPGSYTFEVRAVGPEGPSTQPATKQFRIRS